MIQVLPWKACILRQQGRAAQGTTRRQWCRNADEGKIPRELVLHADEQLLSLEYFTHKRFLSTYYVLALFSA